MQVKRSWQLGRSCESASYHPAKGRFVAGGADMWVYLYDAGSGEELECNKGAPSQDPAAALARHLPWAACLTSAWRAGHHGPVHCLRFAPDGDSYASGSEDGTIRIWDTNFAAKQQGMPNGKA